MTGDKPDRGIKTRFAYGNGDKKMEDGAVSHSAPEWFQIGGVTVTSKLVMKQAEPEMEAKAATPAKDLQASPDAAIPGAKTKASRRAKAQPLGRFSFVKQVDPPAEAETKKQQEKKAAEPNAEAANATKDAVAVPKLKLTPPQRKTSAAKMASLSAPKRTPLSKVDGNQSPAFSTPPVKGASKAGGSLKKRELYRKDALPGRRGLTFSNKESNCIDRQSLNKALAQANPDTTTIHRRRIDVQLVDEEAQGTRCVDMLDAQVRNASLHRIQFGT